MICCKGGRDPCFLTFYINPYSFVFKYSSLFAFDVYFNLCTYAFNHIIIYLFLPSRHLKTLQAPTLLDITGACSQRCNKVHAKA